jgi:hypothetical protein
MIEMGYANVTEVFTAFGQRGVRAEAVAEQCLQEARRYLAAGAPVGEHLADQLMVPMAIAGGGSYVTGEPTEHARTNADVIRRFLDVEVTMTEGKAGTWTVTVGAGVMGRRRGDECGGALPLAASPTNRRGSRRMLAKSKLSFARCPPTAAPVGRRSRKRQGLARNGIPH